MDLLQQILELDKDVFLFFNGFHSDFWDTIMIMITRQETWIPFFASILFFIVKDYKSKALLIVIALVILIAATDQFSNVLKYSVQRLRPTHDPAISHLVHIFFRKGGQLVLCRHMLPILLLFWCLLHVFSKTGLTTF